MKRIKAIIGKILIGTMVFSMLSTCPVAAASKDTASSTPYCPVKQATLDNVKTKYANGKITISGQAKQVKKVKAVYDGLKKTVNVKSNKFTITLPYKSKATIKLYGLNSKNEKITKQKKITSDKFVSADPICYKITHTEKGITYKLNTEPPCVIVAKYKGKTIKEEVVDSSATSFFIPEEQIKGKSGQLIITQETSGKRVS